MGLYTISIPKDDAWEILEAVGKIGSLQFIDLNENEHIFSRTFAPNIKRCDEAERIIKYLMGECERMKVRIPSPKSNLEVEETLKEVLTGRRKTGSSYFEEIEEGLRNYERTLQGQLKNYRELLEHYNALLEYRRVIVTTCGLLGIPLSGVSMSNRRISRGERSESLLGTSAPTPDEPLLPSAHSFSHISGIIDVNDLERFKRIIFRTSRGIIYIYIYI